MNDTKTTETPLTDEAVAERIQPFTEAFVRASFARQLEIALSASKTREAELAKALSKAQEDINWMLNNREFLSGFVFRYIEEALQANASQNNPKETKA